MIGKRGKLLDEKGLVRRFEVDKRRAFEITNWPARATFRIEVSPSTCQVQTIQKRRETENSAVGIDRVFRLAPTSRHGHFNLTKSIYEAQGPFRVWQQTTDLLRFAPLKL